MESSKAPNCQNVEKPGRRTVYSICGMCAVRCPIQVDVEDGRVVWLQGNPHDKGMGTSLCAKGSAGLALEYDDERPHRPMIRTGPRGSGQWREADWGEALDYVAAKLKEVIAEYGGRGVVLSDRGGAFADLTKSFIKALGSPNYFDHDCTCARNAHHAAKSVFGLGRTDLVYDIKNTKHIVLYGRNLLESLQVKEAKEFIEALSKGTKCTYIDIRATVTATKATRFWQIRPNTEYALNLAFINQILKENLYDQAFVARWTMGLESLHEQVRDKTPEWAEEQTGVPADEIRTFVREIAADAPRVIFHAGWMTARHGQSFYTSRSAYILNALLGAIETPGGLIIAKGAKDAGRKGIKKLVDRIPKVTEKRIDGVGWKYKHWDPGSGLLHLLFPALETGDPYAAGAYIVYRHDPLSALPDPEAQIKAYEKLKLLVSIDVNYSETGWYADVILPETTYLERANILTGKSGQKPSIAMRDQAIAPRLDTRPAWWIFKELARRLEIGQYFDFETIEDIWGYQLEDTGVTIDQIREKGLITLADKPILWDRQEGLQFKTPSGKIELESTLLKDCGFPNLAEFQAPPDLQPGHFRLIFGRAAVHNHAHTMNNPILHEILPENTLWIHPQAAQQLGLTDGDQVDVENEGYRTSGSVSLTPFIHPEAVFMYHGFGRTVPLQTRAYKKGMADQRLQKGLLNRYDPVGGGNKLTEAVVRVSKAASGR
jgi:thiosulfate reductase / polysulfide reductase chain A